MIESCLWEQLAALYSSGTLSSAAEKLHLSQPSLSRSMKKLEDVLGVSLFERQKNRIILNETGVLAARYAMRLMEEEEETVKQIRLFDRSLRTFSVGSCAPGPLMELLPQITAAFPELSVSSAVAGVEQLMQGLTANEYAAVILPFKDGDARAKRMLEFYSGMLVAVDSIKGQGTNVEVFAYHSGTTADDIKAIVSKPELAKMDVIFGPLDLPQAQPLSDFCLKNKIRLVLPFATTDMVGKDNPLAYIATDDQEAVQRRAAKMVVAEMGDANYVFVNCQNSDERGRLFTSAMMRSVQGTSNSLHNVSMTDPAATIAAAFSTTKRNVVVINSIRETNLKRLATLMSKSLTENPEMRISVLGYPDWLTFTGESKQLMHQYDAHVYTTFYYDKQADNVQRVDARYKKKFNKLLANSVPCFGYLGFDIGYYVLNGMAKWGDSFEYNQKKQKHNALQHSFTFERDNEKQGFVNHNTRLVHFKPNNQVELK